MTEDKKKPGILIQILIPVVVALLIGGSSPWWWKAMFGSKQPEIPTNVNQQLPPTPSPSPSPSSSEEAALVWAFDADGDGHAGVRWATKTSGQRPSEAPRDCASCSTAGWKTGVPLDDCDDTNPSIFPGAKCKVGIGACRQTGRYVCDASAAVCRPAEVITPQAEFHDSPAPNGSWDWNCDGRDEPQWGVCEQLTREQCPEPDKWRNGDPKGFCTEVRAPGGCIPTVAKCGQSGWIYPCVFNIADGRCHAGWFEQPTTMHCR